MNHILNKLTMKGIYKIINLTNNNSYIGQTDNLTRRERQHFYDSVINGLRNNYYLYY